MNKLAFFKKEKRQLPKPFLNWINFKKEHEDISCVNLAFFIIMKNKDFTFGLYFWRIFMYNLFEKIIKIFNNHYSLIYHLKENIKPYHTTKELLTYFPNLVELFKKTNLESHVGNCKYYNENDLELKLELVDIKDYIFNAFNSDVALFFKNYYSDIFPEFLLPDSKKLKNEEFNLIYEEDLLNLLKSTDNVTLFYMYIISLNIKNPMTLTIKNDETSFFITYGNKIFYYGLLYHTIEKNLINKCIENQNEEKNNFVKEKENEYTSFMLNINKYNKYFSVFNTSIPIIKKFSKENQIALENKKIEICDNIQGNFAMNNIELLLKIFNINDKEEFFFLSDEGFNNLINRIEKELNKILDNKKHNLDLNYLLQTYKLNEVINKIKNTIIKNMDYIIPLDY